MASASDIQPHTAGAQAPDGRWIVDDLPPEIAVMPAEIDLVFEYFAALIDEADFGLRKFEKEAE